MQQIIILPVLPAYYSASIVPYGIRTLILEALPAVVIVTLVVCFPFARFKMSQKY